MKKRYKTIIFSLLLPYSLVVLISIISVISIRYFKNLQNISMTSLYYWKDLKSYSESRFRFHGTTTTEGLNNKIKKLDSLLLNIGNNYPDFLIGKETAKKIDITIELWMYTKNILEKNDLLLSDVMETSLGNKIYNSSLVELIGKEFPSDNDILDGEESFAFYLIFQIEENLKLIMDFVESEKYFETKLFQLNEDIEKIVKILQDSVLITALSMFLIIVFSSISYLRYSQAELEKTKENLSSTLDSIGDGMIVVNENNIITRMNPVAERLTGWKLTEVHDRELSEVFIVVNEDTEKIVSSPVSSILKSRKIFNSSDDTVLISRNGKRYNISSSGAPIINSEKEISGVVLVFRDISKHKEQEAEVQNLRNYLFNIINSMPSILVGVNAKGGVTLWNRTAEQITGISNDNANGKRLSDVFPQMSSEMNRIIESIKTRKVKQTQKKPNKSENGTRFEDITIYPLIANGVEGAVIRIDDVTDLVRMEEIMIQSEKMLSVGELAAGMAHEINNPLAGIVQSATVMENRLGGKINNPANMKAAIEAETSIESIKKYMENRNIMKMVTSIKESGRKVGDIVDNMLNFARKSEGIITKFSIPELINRTLLLAASNYNISKEYNFKNVEIIKDFEENLPFIPCEETKIQQVFLNILLNGVQAMKEAEILKPGFIIKTLLEQDRKMIRIEIEDKGPGIDSTIHNRIFEPFFTTKPEGTATGLGLSISYFIITENHRGKINVESHSGKGAKFIIHLPVESEIS